MSVDQREALEPPHKFVRGYTNMHTDDCPGCAAWAVRMNAHYARHGSTKLIPAGMVPWFGGDSAPEDWDGGPVFYANGLTERPLDHADWKRPAEIPLLAYTPIEIDGTAPASSCNPTSGAYSELEPDDRQEQRSDSLNRQGGSSREIGGRAALFPSCMQRGECDVRGEGRASELTDGCADGNQASSAHPKPAPERHADLREDRSHV